MTNNEYPLKNVRGSWPRPESDEQAAKKVVRRRSIKVMSARMNRTNEESGLRSGTGPRRLR